MVVAFFFSSSAGKNLEVDPKYSCECQNRLVHIVKATLMVGWLGTLVRNKPWNKSNQSATAIHKKITVLRRSFRWKCRLLLHCFSFLSLSPHSFVVMRRWQPNGFSANDFKSIKPLTPHSSVASRHHGCRHRWIKQCDSTKQWNK